MTFRVIVCGGRHYSERLTGKPREVADAEREHVRRVLNEVALATGFDTVVHGAARGADACANEWARENGVVVDAFPADWNYHGRAAGPKRNQAMADAGADLCVAFPGGRGTADMVARVKARGIPLRDERANGPKEGAP